MQFINYSCCGKKHSTEVEMNGSFDNYKQNISPEEAYVHGCCLVFIDSIGSGNSALGTGSCESIKEGCITFLKNQVGLTSELINTSADENNSNTFGIHPFFIQRGEYFISVLTVVP